MIDAGTMLAGFVVFCCGQRQPQDTTGPCAIFCINFLIGFLQLFFAFYLFGWVWSIIWGVLFVQLSSKLVYKYYQEKVLQVLVGQRKGIVIQYIGQKILYPISNCFTPIGTPTN